MNYTSLTASKGISGSIANWVSYTKLDIPVIVDEAQALIYEYLRAREMRTQAVLLFANGTSEVALPARFLDPIGRIKGVDFNLDIRHKDENYITRARTYSGFTGSLGTDPFTTTSGLTTVSVNLTGHGFNQGSTFEVIGASTFNGVTLSPGSYPIVSITDPNNFVIDTVTQTASGSGAGGGASVTYTCNNLIAAVAESFAVWDEKLKLNCAMNQDITGVMNYFQSLPLLSASNQTNFLTNRYPQLIRIACQAAAASFMKDDTEYQKTTQGATGLMAHIQRIQIENDGFYRGLELDPEIP